MLSVAPISEMLTTTHARARHHARARWLLDILVLARACVVVSILRLSGSPQYELGLSLTLWKAWFRRLEPAEQETTLKAYLDAKKKDVHFKTKMCQKYAAGTCRRGNQNSKPRASGVRQSLRG